MKLCFGKKVESDFQQGMLWIRDQFCWDDDRINDLMACMAFESAETFSPKIQNLAGSGAVGLIQFMPITAESLGVSTRLLEKMSAVRQLGYVYKYFKPYAHRIHSISDMYMAILYPAAIGKDDEEILFSHGVAYRQNSALDENTDGMITKGEATKPVRSKRVKGMRDEFSAEVNEDIS